ncbi:Ig-like domain-containing protein [Microbacterium sp. HD4P20]|uniref:Ig-like domain-containing protein n=1 Tax=Microbacterium sp. HD4P20 TaxID=2864874 RepID=UPI001C643F88|nr:Ig-like domain-containing protein [Microbacterium sp. HD4P20]MCP2635152.1 Ig-like domain-containing protein [Microbacterium sp. HD4P20]
MGARRMSRGWGRYAGVLGAMILTLGLVGQPAAASAAPLPDDPLPGDQITITPFYCDPSKPTQLYTVPTGVTSVYIEVVGGQGQTPNPAHTGLGGLGGQVTGGLNVTHGQQLQVQVGCAGTSEGGASAYAPGGARGTGWSNLNDFFTIYSFGYDGGGGGGASAILDAAGNPLAVAGGGGGAAGDAPNCLESSTLKNGGGGFFYYCGPGLALKSGGDGGDGGGDDTEGGAGENNTAGTTADGTECGGPNAGGKGADFHTTGGGGAGGGGGGGHGGGCGGAAGQEAQIDPGHEEIAPGSAGAGGGGGASYASSAVNNPQISVADDSGDGYVLILTSADGVRTSHFDHTGHPQTFCVPDGVDEIFVDALGGGGGGGGSDFPDRTGIGGAGGGVQAVVPVVERTQLEIRVGQYGHASGGWGDGHGGHRGTSGSEGDGAGGGGSTAVKQSSTPCGVTTGLENLQYLVVGGGGGGGGGYAVSADGGDGGNAGSPGADGSVGGDPDGGASGCGGQHPGNGCENSVNGGHATSATDGGGGGGGGGGYHGGGKGHGAQDGRLGGGGGGGGGASYVTPHSPDPVHYYSGPRGDHSNRDGLNEGKVDLIVPVPTSRSAVNIVSGNNQSATTGSAFAEPLVVEYVDAIHGPTSMTAVELTIAQVDGRLPATFVGAPGDGSTFRGNTGADGRMQAQLTAALGAPLGKFTVEARVVADPAHLIKTAEFSLFSVPWPTTLALTSDAVAVDGSGVAAVGESITYTATVTSTAVDQPVNSGAIQFSVDGTNLGDPVPLAGDGVATSPPSPAGAEGQHHVLATYTDTATGHQASTFTNYALTVLPPSTSQTSLTSSAPDGLYGDESVTFPVSVTVIGDAPFEPTGTVQLFRGTAPLGDPIPLSAGAGTSQSFPASAFGLGDNEITAVYSGNDRVDGSTSGVYTLFVVDLDDRPPSTDPPGGGDPRPGASGGSGQGALPATGVASVPFLLAIGLIVLGVVLTRTRRPYLHRPED